MIRGQGRINVFINIKRAHFYKKQFEKELVKYKFEISKANQNFVPLTLYSFSGNAQFSDQVLSILSFVKNVGIPNKWIIISDGSHDNNQSKYFQSFPFIEYKLWYEWIDERFDQKILETKFWQIKKLIAFANIPVDSSTILLDSDILFFNRFKDYINCITNKNWYLADLEPHFDDDYNHSPNQNYTNSGFIVLNHAIDWEQGIQYIIERLELGRFIGHFSEQTAIEIVVKKNELSFLDPRLFLLELKDHFTLNSTYNHDNLAVRHFVGPIRFRMWTVAKQYANFL